MKEKKNTTWLNTANLQVNWKANTEIWHFLYNAYRHIAQENTNFNSCKFQISSERFQQKAL